MAEQTDFERAERLYLESAATRQDEPNQGVGDLEAPDFALEPEQELDFGC
jgi:hypothetical protein